MADSPLGSSAQKWGSVSHGPLGDGMCRHVGEAASLTGAVKALGPVGRARDAQPGEDKYLVDTFLNPRGCLVGKGRCSFLVALEGGTRTNG